MIKHGSLQRHSNKLFKAKRGCFRNNIGLVEAIKQTPTRIPGSTFIQRTRARKECFVPVSHNQICCNFLPPQFRLLQKRISESRNSKVKENTHTEWKIAGRENLKANDISVKRIEQIPKRSELRYAWPQAIHIVSYYLHSPSSSFSRFPWSNIKLFAVRQRWSSQRKYSASADDKNRYLKGCFLLPVHVHACREPRGDLVNYCISLSLSLFLGENTKSICVKRLNRKTNRKIPGCRILCWAARGKHRVQRVGLSLSCSKVLDELHWSIWGYSKFKET